MQTTEVAEPKADQSSNPDKKEAELTEVEGFGAECRAGLEAAKRLLPGILAVSGSRTEENLLSPFNLLQANVERSLALAGLTSM